MSTDSLTRPRKSLILKGLQTQINLKTSDFNKLFYSVYYHANVWYPYIDT